MNRLRNVNYVLNFSPNKEGVFSQGMNDVLSSLANWMKVNGTSLDKVSSLNGQETATEQASMKVKHRFLFVMAENKAEIIKFNFNEKVRKIKVLADKQKVKFSAKN